MTKPNVAAWFESGSVESGQAVHLLLDDQGRWAWVKTGWFSTDISESKYEGSGLIRNARFEFQKSGILMFSEYRIAITASNYLEKGGVNENVTLIFNVSGDSGAGQKFVDVCNALKRRDVIQEEIIGDLRRRLKSRARVNLRELSTELFETAQSKFKEAPLAGHPGTREAFADWVFTNTEHLIDKGELKGILDPSTKEYLDRDMTPRQHRVINLDVNLDFKDLLGALSKGGVEVSSVRCPQCAAPCLLPDKGETVVCPHCASTLRVADVVRILREFLS